MTIAYLLLLHFIADFLLQSRKMGKEKSEKFHVLLQHVTIQIAVFFFGMLPFFEAPQVIFFAWANALIHGVIDWYIWRGYKLSVWWRNKDVFKEKGVIPLNKKAITSQLAKNWKYWEDGWFYKTIGFDQLLHGVTIVGVWTWINSIISSWT